MELEVKAVGGIRSCFISLPVHFIQTLQLTNGGILPPVIALELRSGAGDCWNFGWAGSASSSSAIEVSQQLAACVSLPDHIAVQVRVIMNLPKAKLALVEPNSEDDWEILELNSELAEMSILKQVAVIHEGMKFPLWIHGHTFVEFLVISTSPRSSAVQLVAGTEVAITPKMRKKNIISHAEKVASTLEPSAPKALIRVVTPSREHVFKFEIAGLEIGVVLTFAVFIHPDTANDLLINNFQLVNIFRRLFVKKMQNHGDISSQKESFTSAMNEKETAKQAFVHVLFSSSVAKGHILIPRSLCLYLRVGTHSWVYVKRCDTVPRNDLPPLTLSPCQFQVNDDKPIENSRTDILQSRKNTQSINFKSNLVVEEDNLDWSLHDKVISVLSSECSCFSDKELLPSKTLNGCWKLIYYWFIGQLKAVASYIGDVGMKSVFLGRETLLHFEVMFPELSKTGKPLVDVIYVLTTTPEYSQYGVSHVTFEISLETEVTVNSVDLKSLNLSPELLDMGNPVIFHANREQSHARFFKQSISSLSWMREATSDVINRLSVLLSPISSKLLSSFSYSLPGHILIHGPSGSGKTCLAMTVAKYLEEHVDILAHVIFVSCSKLSSQNTRMTYQALSGYFSEALDHAPSLIIFDDLDSIVLASARLESALHSNSVGTLVNLLTGIMSDYGENWQTSCGIGPVAFLACAQSPDNLPRSLCSSGRFDFHIKLHAPTLLDRGAILKSEIQKRLIHCADDVLSSIASKCDGYDSYDLEIVVDRAVHAAIGRYLCFEISREHEMPVLLDCDFSQAMIDFVPVALRGIAKSASQSGRSGWDDVGGLHDVRNTIHEMIELPLKFPNIFANAPLRSRSNVLLYGPPGCGKTHVVGAVAAACSLRFISIKGPELLNKYIGASEQAVRDIFSKAADAAPCLLFFDEFDSIAPKRGHDNTGVTDRVVNQLLTELDGVETLTGVFVFAATSRPDLIDAALLRPGRFDRLLFCDFPCWDERLDILRVLSRKLPLGVDVNLATIASMTDGFSGADLQALLSDAQLASIHEFLEHKDGGQHEAGPIISDELLKSVASSGRPSISEAEMQRFYGIYSHFMDSRKSTFAQSRTIMGKRATLA